MMLEKMKTQTRMSNGLIVNIVVGKYENGANSNITPLYLKTDHVIRDLRRWANDIRYTYMPLQDKIYWTEQEISSFLRDDVGSEFLDESGTPKYDGLIVCVTGYGTQRDILSSDHELMDKIAIHRIISNHYAQIRDFPRIFMFDTRVLPEDYTMTVGDIEQNFTVNVTSQHVVPTNSAQLDIGDSTMVPDIGKKTDFEDVREVNEWTFSTKNPDYNLVFIKAMHTSPAPFVVQSFINSVRDNMKNDYELGLNDIIDKVRPDAYEHGASTFIPVLNNKTRTMIIHKKVAGS